MFKTGGVLSMLSATHVFVLFPALSIAVPHILCPAPSVVTVIGAEHEAMPDVASLHVKLTATSVLFHPSALAEGLASAVITGSVLSMFNTTDVVALFPALSTAVPVITCPAPSVVTVIGDGQEAMSEPESAHVNVTVTSVLFQPFALGAGIADGVSTGGTVSHVPVI